MKYFAIKCCIQTSSTFVTLSQFIHYSLENGNKWLFFSEKYFTGFVRPSVWLSQALNLTTQLDYTSLDQLITKQCLMLFRMCVKRALAIKEKHT